jgi:hypothetical protein
MSKSHQAVAKSRRPYRKPHLKKLGDLRTLTLGGSLGTGDSGTSFAYKRKMGLPQPGGYYPPEFYPRPEGAPPPADGKSDDPSQP